MTKLTLFITENLPTSLRGELTRWMLEIKPGVFISALSALVREKLWDLLKNKNKYGGIIMIKSKNNEQKFDIEYDGYFSRDINDFEGLKLITYPSEAQNMDKKIKKLSLKPNPMKKKTLSLYEQAKDMNEFAESINDMLYGNGKKGENHKELKNNENKNLSIVSDNVSNQEIGAKITKSPKKNKKKTIKIKDEKDSKTLNKTKTIEEENKEGEQKETKKLIIKNIPKRPKRGMFSTIELLQDLDSSKFHQVKDYFPLIECSKPSNLPENFIDRYISAKIIVKKHYLKNKKGKDNKNYGEITNNSKNANNHEPEFTGLNKDLILFGGRSNYEEYSKDQLWSKKFSQDVIDNLQHISKIIHEQFYFLFHRKNSQSTDDLTNHLNLSNIIGKKIISLDIETTDFIPKAFEGFVNIIGITQIDFSNISLEKITHSESDIFIPINIYQAFNMHRKKHDAPQLLPLFQNIINTSDMLIVYNQDFDLKILQTLRDNSNTPIDLVYPEIIIDPSKKFQKLEELESLLKNSKNFQRTHTKKGNYSHYYRLFKGYGSKGLFKQIEPIGAYNILDTLSPMIYFLKNDLIKKQAPQKCGGNIPTSNQ